MRTDIHRPSVINPEEYLFVGMIVPPELVQLDSGLIQRINSEREKIFAHMAATGGKYSNHEHGGTCHCCGAYAKYRAVYHHEKTNSYIQLGETCAEKLDLGESEAFRTVRRAIKDARDAQAGKRKAQLLLADHGLEAAWEIYTLETAKGTPNDGEYEESKVISVVGSVVRWGNISERQVSFLRSLLAAIPQRAAKRAQMEAEKASRPDVPEGRYEVSGVILNDKIQEGYMGGTVHKMLVKDDRGFVIWGSVPISICFDAEGQAIELKGTRVSFVATVEKSKDDAKFGFFKRPTKAAVIEKAA